jgi:hypothetical protein
VVGKTMTKNTYTLLETLKTHNGKNVIFKKEILINYFKNDYEENFLNLSNEEKHEAFQVDLMYGDLITKILKEPLQKMLEEFGANWALQDEERNPIEEYEHIISLPKNEDMTEEQWNLKIERLRIAKEWYEQNIG